MKRLIKLSMIIFSIIILSSTVILVEEPVASAKGPAVEQTAPALSTEQVLLAPDPPGFKTGGAADVVGASANAPTADDLKNLGTKEPHPQGQWPSAGHLNRL